MPNEPLIRWPDPLFELVGFLSVFLTAGAVGFRFAALPRLLNSAAEGDRDFALAAARRAGRNGMVGALIGVSLLVQSLPAMAERRHLTVSAFLALPQTELQVGLLAAVLVGLALAGFGAGFGWPIAALGVLLTPVRGAFFGQFNRLVNPLHELAGGLWIGSLAMVVFAGILPALRDLAPARRGPVVARLVKGFSPLALFGAGLLGAMGVITAWTHLKRLESLWTTPYGWTLIAKLCVVGVVLGFGALNWRKLKPNLGDEAGARAIRGSALTELALAGVVLLITSVLVSLPSPR